MVLGVAFEFPFWDIFDFGEDSHSLSSVLHFFYFLTQSVFSSTRRFHKRHGIRSKGVAKEVASLLMEELNGGSRAPHLALSGSKGSIVIEGFLRYVRDSLLRTGTVVTCPYL